MKHLAWFLLGLLVALPGRSQPADVDVLTPGSYVEHRADGPTVTVEGEGASAQITFYRPAVVRVDWLPPGAAPDSSFSVVRSPEDNATPTVREGPRTLWIRSREATVAIQKDPLRLRFADETGRRLVSEVDSGFVARDTTRALQFSLKPETRLYGTGERVPFGLRGDTLRMDNQAHYGYADPPMPMKINVPFLTTTGGYGLFVDNTHPAEFDLGAADSTQIRYTTPGGELSYYVIAASRIPEQLRHYTWLTGRQPMPPKWSLGYIQSKFGYENEAQARGVVDTLRRKDIPVDAVILDLDWFEHMGDLRWNRAAFPEPFDMMRDLEDRGVQTVAITETYLTSPSRLYEPALDSGFVGTRADGTPYVMDDWWSCDSCQVALLDVTEPAARDWWARQHTSFMGDDMAGFWTDLGEPERHPADMQHHQGPRDNVHNVYNHLWAQLLFRHWREERPNQRVYNLTRSAFAGTQRYNPTLWSGDVARSFEAFRPQIPFLLNMGLAGFSLYGSDLGGFTGEGPTPELYTRWMQHGALSPTMRPHGSDAPTEPWRFGTQAETITREMVRLRYRLMPYLYTLAWESHRTGMPMVRPLFFADPSDRRLHDVQDSYLLGESLLVAPVLRDSARTRSVRLPEGTWVNYWTDEAIEGGRTVTVDAPLDQIPLFVRGGALVPMRPVAPHVGAQPQDTLALAVYPDAERSTSVSLYEDDGTTLAYQEGAYAQTELSQQLHARSDRTADLSVVVGETVGQYTDQPGERTVQVRVHRVTQRPDQVTLNGEALSPTEWKYDDGEGRLTVQFREDIRQAHRIVVRGIGRPDQF
ncbi:MAG: glycoside hydrolase family 31 protein [Salinibacter sp.]